MLKDFFIPTTKNKKKPYLLSKPAILLYTLFLLLINQFGAILGIEQAYASTINPGNIISLTNQERRLAGLGELKNNSQLASAALAKANDMFAKQYWDHFGPNGETPWQFIKGAGYSYIYAGENLGKGFRTAEGLVEAWMASPTHRENILSSNYRDIGIAVVEGELLGKQTILVVQMFGNLTKSVQPAPAPSPTPAPPAVVGARTKPKVVTGEQRVVTLREQGEIRSIRITSPDMGSTVTDSTVNIKGETTNTTGGYTVNILENNEVVGSTEATGNSWEVKKGSDWSEGEHKIVATIKGTEVKSPESTFIVDSKAPEVDSTTIRVVEQDETFVLTFNVNGDCNEINIILDSNIVTAKVPDNGKEVKASIPKEPHPKSVYINTADAAGNSSSIEISEYFKVKEESKQSSFPAISLSVRDGINIGVVLLVLFLLILNVVWFTRRGKFKESIGEVFTVGAWWIIVTVSLFTGFSGSIT